MEKLSERIYSRVNPPKQKGRRLFREYKKYDVSESIPDFAESSESYDKDTEQNKQANHIVDLSKKDIKSDVQDIHMEEDLRFWTAPKIFLFISLVFFLFSSALAYFFIIKGINEVDQNKIAMIVNGPSYINSGETAQLQIVIENQNSAPLELADLVIDYPPGTIVPGEEYKIDTVDYNGALKRVVRQRLSLDSIGARELKKGVVKARLYGKKDDIQNINVKLQYRVKGSNAVFEIVKNYPIRFSSDALSISIDGPSESIFGQKPKVKVLLKNTSSDNLLNIALKAQLPLGVKVIKSEPEIKDGAWEFVLLEPGEEKEITMQLEVDGQTGDERVIKFVAGVEDPDADIVNIDYSLAQAEHKLLVKRPFLLTEINLPNKKDGYYVVKPNSAFNTTLNWLNTLPTSMEDLVIALTLQGDALDKYKVKPGSGFYKSKDNIIVWDKTTAGKSFETVSSGASGRLNFTLGVKDTAQLIKYINPGFSLILHASAKRLSDPNSQNTLTAFMEKEVRVQTEIKATSRSLYFSNPLKSGGALPPKADNPTVYGIEWEVTNSTNLTKDVEMTGFLPPNVNWGQVFLPANERIDYNPTNGKVTWSLGEVKPGTGYYLPSRKVFFNVVLTPSVNQIGKTPTLINNQILKAKDVFTDTDISLNIPNTTTKLQEPQANDFYYRVVK